MHRLRRWRWRATDITRGADAARYRIIVAAGGGGAGIEKNGDEGGGLAVGGLLCGEPCIQLRNIRGDGKDATKKDGHGSRGFNLNAGPRGGGVTDGDTGKNGLGGCAGTGKAGPGGTDRLGGGNGHGVALISWKQQTVKNQAETPLITFR